jgi:hypothetical protein
MTEKKRLPIVAADEWLQPVEEQIEMRHNRYRSHLTNVSRFAGHIGTGNQHNLIRVRIERR